MALCFHNISSEAGLLGGLFLAGLAGGFTHCIAMCGPFVMAQTGSTQAQLSFVQKLKGSLLLPYHLGRMTTYITLAIIFSAVLNAALFFSPLKNIIGSLLLLTAALIFLINALPALGTIFPYLARVTLPVPRDFILRISHPFINGKNFRKRYMLGLLLGFMPCGLVMAALMAVIALENPMKSGMGMGLFALGTMPALILAALGGQLAYARFPRALPALRLMMLMASTGVLLLTAGKMILS